MANALITRKNEIQKYVIFTNNSSTMQYSDVCFAPNGVRFYYAQHTYGSGSSQMDLQGSNDKVNFTTIVNKGSAEGGAEFGNKVYKDYKYYRVRGYVRNNGNANNFNIAILEILSGGVLTKLLTLIANIFRKEVLA